MDSLRRLTLYMKTKIAKIECSEQLGSFMLGIVSVVVARTRGFLMSETDFHALYGHFFRENFGADVRGGYRGTTPTFQRLFFSFPFAGYRGSQSGSGSLTIS